MTSIFDSKFNAFNLVCTWLPFLLFFLIPLSHLCSAWDPPDSIPKEKPFYQLAIAAIFRDEAPYLKEWVEYHHMVGVDHFFLYNNGSADHWQEVLAPYIQEGLIEVFDWPSERESYNTWQIKAYQDAITRSAKNTEWIALIDIDEFILPMEDKSIIECLDKHFEEASAVYVSQRLFGTSHISLLPDQPLLTNLTGCAVRNYEMNSSGKTIVKPKKVIVDQIVSEHCFPVLREGVGYYNSDAGYMDYWGGKLRMCYHHDRYLRINHYTLRDENFFQNSRLQKARKGIYGSVEQFMKYHKDLSETQDYRIINLIKKHYPEKYRQFWLRITPLTLDQKNAS